MMEPLEGVDLSFACRCGDGPRAEIAAVTAWAFEHEKIDPANLGDLIDRIIYGMDLRYHAELSFDADQWGAVSADTFPGYVKGSGEGTYPEDRRIEAHSTYIQCDSFVDGLIFTWRSFYEKYGDKVAQA